MSSTFPVCRLPWTAARGRGNQSRAPNKNTPPPPLCRLGRALTSNRDANVTLQILMPNLYSEDRLRLAARLYYIDGLGQSDVAKFVKVSQAKVSRLLALARERGIVRITVADYEPRHTELEAQIRSRLGLSTVVVIKAFEGLAESDLRKAVGHFRLRGAERADQARGYRRTRRWSHHIRTRATPARAAQQGPHCRAGHGQRRFQRQLF
jgi:hypothetical protein